MSKYRFAGTVKEIVLRPGEKLLRLYPDREYISSFKKDKDTTITYAVLQAEDPKVLGYAFAFENAVSLECDVKSCLMSIGTHYVLSLTTDLGKGIVDVTFLDIPDADKGK
jgi:hypothetical protein